MQSDYYYMRIFSRVITYLALSIVLLLHKKNEKIGKWSDMSLRKRPLIEGRSRSFSVKMSSIKEALFAVIGRLMSGKNILEYNKSKKSLVALWQWWLIRFKFQSPLKIQAYFLWKFFSVLGLRACLHGGRGPQLGEVTRLGGVKK